MERAFHAVANIFPLMSGEEFDALVADIEQNGLIEPIWLHPDDDSIIDGRNRYLACKKLGIMPEFRTWNRIGSLIEFVLSLNVHRRHLTSMQRAAIGVGLLPMLEAEAKERQLAAGAAGAAGAEFGYLGGRGNKNPLGQNFDQGGFERSPKSTERIADMMNTNHQYVSDAKRISEQSPEVFNLIKQAKVNGNEAKKLARMPKEKRSIVIDEMLKTGERLPDAIKATKKQLIPPAPLPGKHGADTKYRILYADPPWRYGNTMPDYFDEQGDHYPLMTPFEIAMLPVREMADDNAVLFLWVTSPILEESFEVVNSWGFKYKSTFIWDKVKHNMGHYNSVRHEILLVCTRGSCQPDVQKLFDSVQSIERTNKHSEKPEEFREIIDTLYPYGARIELFARKEVDGWSTWGNEVSNGN